MLPALTIAPVDAELCGPGFFLEGNPFKVGAMRYVEMADGATLDDYVAAAAGLLPPGYQSYLQVWIGEHRIPAANWALVRPKPTASVYIRVRPQGKGAKNIFRAVLMIALVAVAAYFLGPLAFLAGGWLGLSLGATAAAAASAAAIGVATLVGTLLINALIPPPGLSNSQGRNDPRYQLTGSNNRFAPYAPVPRLFGKMKMFPLLAARPFSENVGKHQYLRMLLLVGWGPIKVSDIRIGNSPITAFRNVEYEIHEGGPPGWAGNAEITLYNRRVTEQQFNFELFKDVAAPFQTTAFNCVEIGVDISFPYGLIEFEADGDQDTATSRHRIEYRVAGSGGAWLAAPLIDDASTRVENTNVLVSKEKSKEGVRHTARFKVAEGQYEVRVTRLDVVKQTAGDGDDTWVDKSFWTILRSYSTDEPVVQEGVCLIAIRIQASEQLNGVPDTISCVAESYLPVLNGELVTNGGFDDDVTGWTPALGARSVVGGRLRVSNTGVGFARSYQSFTTEVGKSYRFGFTAWAGTGVGQVMLGSGGVSSNDYYNSGAFVGLDDGLPHYVDFTATTTTTTITLLCNSGTIGQYAEFDFLTVRPLDPDASDWAYELSQNPAWAYADVLRRRANEAYLPDNRIDLPAIMAWAEDCATPAPNSVEPRWTFNGVLEGGSVFEGLRTIAAIGRASYTMKDGKHSVVRDREQATPVQHITPANSWGYSGTRTFIELPHAFKIEFQNKDMDYLVDERVVYADGYDETTASRFEVLQLFGATSPELVYREARYHLAVGELRPEEHRVQMDIESLRCTMGDRVQLSHDVIKVGLGFGRIVALTTSGANTIGFELDNAVPFDALTYQLRVRHADGTTSLRTVTAAGGAFNNIAWSEAMDVASQFNTTTTANVAVAPDGTTTADKVIPSVANAQHDIDFADAPISYVGPAVFSIYAKPAGYKRIGLGFYDGVTYRGRATFDVSAGAIVDNTAGVAGMEEVGDGWYRCWVAFDIVLTGFLPVVFVQNDTTLIQAPYAGDGTSGVYLWGAQVDFNGTTAGGSAGHYVATSGAPKYGGPTEVVACAAEPTATGPQPGDLFMFGETGLETMPALVKRIEPGDDLSAQLILVPYNAGIYTADTGTIPAFESFLTTDYDRTAPAAPLVALRGDQTAVDLTPAGAVVRLAVDITAPPSSRIPIEGYEVRYRQLGAEDWTPVGLLWPFGTMTVFIAPVSVGATYQVAVRSKGMNGLFSDWVDAADIVVTGNIVVPMQPSAASVQGVATGNLAKWTNPANSDLRGVQLWMNRLDSFNGAVQLGETLTGQILHSPVAPGDTYYYWLVSVNTSGLTSSALAIGSVHTPEISDGVGGDSYVEPTGGAGWSREGWGQGLNLY